MNILFYGAGALGQALGCMLAQAGHRVDLVLRRRYINAVKVQGLSVQGVMGDFHVSAGEIGMLESLADAQGSYDYVVITTKTYDTEAAAAAVSLLGDRASTVVSMQNGCGNLEILEERFGRERCLAARVITGFEIIAPGRVSISVTADAIHVGRSHDGAAADAAEKLAQVIDQAGHPCVAVSDINQSLFAKLLYNCALNPLGAIMGVHYGALAESKETRFVMNRIIDETFDVVEALGGKTPWKTAEQYKKYFYDSLIPATYNHRASMLQDLEGGKRTEVDALVGYVSRMGDKLGISTPSSDLLASLVRFKEGQLGK